MTGRTVAQRQAAERGEALACAWPGCGEPRASNRSYCRGHWAVYMSSYRAGPARKPGAAAECKPAPDGDHARKLSRGTTTGAAGEEETMSPANNGLAAAAAVHTEAARDEIGRVADEVEALAAPSRFDLLPADVGVGLTPGESLEWRLRVLLERLRQIAGEKADPTMVPLLARKPPPVQRMAPGAPPRAQRFFTVTGHLADQLEAVAGKIAQFGIAGDALFGREQGKAEPPAQR
jgi:hypothetical protein